MQHLEELTGKKPFQTVNRNFAFTKTQLMPEAQVRFNVDLRNE
jgi:hypothetical protein